MRVADVECFDPSLLLAIQMPGVHSSVHSLASLPFQGLK